jgi:microcystin degradation protein MlrC
MCIGGFFDAAEECGFEIVPILWGFAYPSGVIARHDYETLKAEFIARLAGAAAMGGLDGVLLDLHGAMVVEASKTATRHGRGRRAAIGSNRPMS